MKKLLIIMAIIVTVVTLSVFAVFSVQNKAISYEGQISIAESEINVQEKRRSDLIPNLVDCVKQYDEHEYQTLMAVVNVRGTTSDEAVEEIQTMIAAVAEAYPELKGSENYRELMNELAVTENLIANVRTNYNTWVNKYGIYVKQFPNYQVLSVLGYEAKTYQNLEFEGASANAPTNLFDE